MYVRIFVSGESDVTDFPGCASLKQCGVRSLGVKNAVWIVKPYDLVMLDQIDVVDIEATQRFFKLSGSLLSGASVNLGHHKRTVAVSVPQSLAHAFLTRAIVIVPGGIEEVDASIDGRTNDTNCQRLVNSFQT